MEQGCAPVDRKPVPADQRLRHLLRAGRRASGRLSQKTAAQRVGISPVYWQQIESGRRQAVPAGTLAAMLLAAGISAGQLRDEGYEDIASILDELAGIAAGAPAGMTAEDHLAATPDATPEEISALQAVWLALRAKRTPDPFGPDLPDPGPR